MVILRVYNYNCNKLEYKTILKNLIFIIICNKILHKFERGIIMNETSILKIEDIESGKTMLKIKKSIYLFSKRLVDIIFGLIGCILLIPITVIIKLVSICNKDFYTIFFTQDRIGKNGKRIKIYKFRSMIPNAEEKLEELMKNDPKIKEEYLKNKKLIKDPRITKIGWFIRKYSIDELPQLINVLIGNMTLVGPRPYLFREKEDMGKYYDYVITCKPGITGLWQVSGRSDISFKKRLKLDKKYSVEKSIKLDINILFRTFRAVIGTKGAK